jgi:hypothetical protein
MANPSGTPQNLRPKPWPKGVSGNPGGRPKKSLQAALEAELDAKPELLRAMVQKGLKMALEGDFRYWAAIWDRLEGKVTTNIEINDKAQINWAELDNESDTPPRNAIDPKGASPIPDGGEA